MDTNGVLLNIFAIGLFAMAIYFQKKMRKISKNDDITNKNI